MSERTQPVELVTVSVSTQNNSEGSAGENFSQQNAETAASSEPSDFVADLPKDHRKTKMSGRCVHSGDINQAWFTTKQDKTELQEKGVGWNRGMWSKTEVDILSQNIENYCKQFNIEDPRSIVFENKRDQRGNFYKAVAAGLERPLFAVYRRVLRMYDEQNYRGRYSPQELSQLKELREKHGSDWTVIGHEMGRSASSVKDRCRLMKESCNTGKWLPDEEQLLAEAVYEQTGKQPGEDITSSISWSKVMNHVETRSEKQCRAKWLNYLNWKQRQGDEWTRTDDVRLINEMYEANAMRESDINWASLADGWLSARSPQWLRSKWWTIKRHIKNYQNYSFPKLVEMAFHQQETIFSSYFESKLNKKSAAQPKSTPQRGHSTENVITENDGAPNVANTPTVLVPGGVQLLHTINGMQFLQLPDMKFLPIMTATPAATASYLPPPQPPAAAGAEQLAEEDTMLDLEELAAPASPVDFVTVASRESSCLTAEPATTELHNFQPNATTLFIPQTYGQYVNPPTASPMILQAMPGQMSLASALNQIIIAGNLGQQQNESQLLELEQNINEQFVSNEQLMVMPSEGSANFCGFEECSNNDVQFIGSVGDDVVKSDPMLSSEDKQDV